MNKKKIKVENLDIGMFIEINGSWLTHDFVTNKFKITSEEQLEKLKSQKFKEVIIDIDKSTFRKRPPAPTRPKPAVINDRKPVAAPPPRKTWKSEFVTTDNLRNILDDAHLAPDKKAHKTYQASTEMMEQLLAQPTKENINASKQAIRHMSEMALTDSKTAKHMLHLTSHDYQVYSHSVNVGFYGLILSKELYKDSTAHDLEEMSVGFFLHDLGKTAIEAEVLNKPGKLTDIERQHIKTHPYLGYKMLLAAGEVSETVKVIVLQHHERYDGTGYPGRLKARDIHEYARICAIADVYDAITTEHSYKKAIGSFDALRLMKNEMLPNFDSDIFRKFVQLFI